MYVFLKNENGGVLEQNQDNLEIVRRQEGKTDQKGKKWCAKYTEERAELPGELR